MDKAVGVGCALGHRGQIGAEEDGDDGGRKCRISPVVEVPTPLLAAAIAQVSGRSFNSHSSLQEGGRIRTENAGVGSIVAQAYYKGTIRCK